MTNDVVSEDILTKDTTPRPPKIGEIVQGKVVAKKSGTLFLDLGPAGAGIIYGKEFLDARDVLKNLKIGDSVFTKVVDLENEEGYFELSISQAGKEIAWEELRQNKTKGEIIKVKVLGANKGGLLAKASGVLGFLPVSQLNQEHYPKIEGGKTELILKELQKLVGKDLEVQVFDLDPRNEKLIFSEKSKEIGKIREALKNYKIGDVVEGEITGILDFGAFVKFGDKESLEGLIHISELDWKLIENPAQVLEMGQKVKAKIIEIQDSKVSLSLKALKKDPWQDIEEKYKKGNKVKGEVKRFNHFGAFVHLTPEIQGLCHISEFGTRAKMEEKLEIGKKYDFQIISIDPKEHKMNLKLATAEEGK